MITITTWSYHELKRKWTGTEYVERPFDDVKQMVLKLEEASKNKRQFVKSQMFLNHLASDEEIQKVCDLNHHGRLAYQWFFHGDNREDQFTLMNNGFYLDDEFFEELENALNREATIWGAPEVARIVVTFV